MQTTIGLILLFLFATASIAFGYDRGGKYLKKVADTPEFAVRSARLDLLSYLLTSVPLVGALMALLTREPGFIVRLELPDGWRDFTTSALGLIASIGIGLGLARRRWVLIAATKRQ